MRYVLALLVILGLTVYSTPYLIKDQLLIWFKTQGVKAPTLNSISINWLNGTVTIDQLSTQVADLAPLNLEHLTLTINYPKLFDQQLQIDQLTIKRLTTGFSEHNNQRFIGPINLDQFSASNSQSNNTDTPSPWLFGIKHIDLTNINLTATTPAFNHHLQIDSAAVSNFQQWQPNQQSDFSLTGKLNQAPIEISASSDLLSLQPKSQLQIAFKHLDLAKASAGLMPQLSGTASADLTLWVDINDLKQGFSANIKHQGSLSFSTLNWHQKQQQLSVKDAKWQGAGQIAVQKSQLKSSSLKGAFLLENFDLTAKNQQKLQFQKLNWLLDNTLETNEKQKLTITSSDKISLAGLNFSQSNKKLKLVGLNVNPGKIPLQMSLINNQLTTLSLPFKIALQQAHLNSGEQQMSLTNLSLSQTKALNLHFAKEGIKTLTGAPKLSVATLLMSAPEQQLQLNSLAFAGPLELKSDQQQWRISADNQLSFDSVKAVVDKIKLNSAKFSSQMTLKDTASSNLSIANLDLQAANLDVESVVTAMGLASVDHLNIKGAALNKARIFAQSISATNVGLAREDNSAPLTQFAAIELQQLMLKELTKLKIASIQLVDSNSQLQIDEAGQLPTLVALNRALNANSTQQTAKASSTPAATKGFQYHIGQLQISGNNLINIEDKSVDPWFTSQIDVQQLTLSQISNQKNQASPFTLKALINERANLTFDGQVNLLDPAQSSRWTVSLESASLPVISPYAGKFSGYFLENGKLAIKGKGQIQNNTITGENNITIEQLAVRSADSAATKKTNSSLNMPLDIAISVLEDDNGNINLTVPVSGSLDDPNFGYSSIVEIIAKKGLKKAAFGILSKALQPYGALITLATTAIDAKNSGTFINLAPVSFTPGTDQIDSKMQAYLRKIADMMKQRKKLKLKICATGVSQDKVALNTSMQAANKKSSKPLSPQDLDKSILNALQTLADTRGKNVEQLLIDKGIDNKRLFVCFAKTNLKQASLKPVVNLGL